MMMTWRSFCVFSSFSRAASSSSCEALVMSRGLRVAEQDQRNRVRDRVRVRVGGWKMVQKSPLA